MHVIVRLSCYLYILLNIIFQGCINTSIYDISSQLIIFFIFSGLIISLLTLFTYKLKHNKWSVWRIITVTSLLISLIVSTIGGNTLMGIILWIIPELIKFLIWGIYFMITFLSENGIKIRGKLIKIPFRPSLRLSHLKWGVGTPVIASQIPSETTGQTAPRIDSNPSETTGQTAPRTNSNPFGLSRLFNPSLAPQVSNNGTHGGNASIGSAVSNSKSESQNISSADEEIPLNNFNLLDNPDSDRDETRSETSQESSMSNGEETLRYPEDFSPQTRDILLDKQAEVEKIEYEISDAKAAIKETDVIINDKKRTYEEISDGNVKAKLTKEIEEERVYKKMKRVEIESLRYEKRNIKGEISQIANEALTDNSDSHSDSKSDSDPNAGNWSE